MKAKNYIEDDEIDLVELFKTLWKGKLIIFLTTALSVVLTSLYLVITPAKFTASSEFSVNFYPTKTLTINVDVLKEYKPHFSQWTIKGTTLTKSLLPNYDITSISQELKHNNEQLTQATLKQEKKELSYIQNLPSELLNTETAAKNYLHVNRIIDKIENEQEMTLIIQEPVISKTPKSGLIIALSTILGLMIGIAAVLIRAVIQKQL